MNQLRLCESCGMPIKEGMYCQYCVDEIGELQNFDRRFETMVNWSMKQDASLSLDDAESNTRVYMGVMSARKDHPKLMVEKME